MRSKVPVELISPIFPYDFEMVVAAETKPAADSQMTQAIMADHSVALPAKESRSGDDKSMSQREDGVEVANTILRSPGSTEPQPCQKAKDADIAFTYFEHLKVCQKCREHEIEAFGERIKVLKQLDPSYNSDDDEESPQRQTEQKREIVLKKIPTGKYRQIKNWPAGSLGDAPVLLYTTDGSEFGIRRVENENYFRADLKSSQDRGDTSVPASNTPEEIPFRLVFNSADLMKILEKVTEDEITAANPVHVRPFKYLLKHEFKIRSTLERIEQALHKHPGNSPVNAVETPKGLQVGVSTTETESTTVEGVPVTERSLKLLQCLMGFVDNEMRDILAVRKQIAGGTLEDISFEYLLHLFKPGDLVLAEPHLPGEERRAYRVLYVTGGRSLFETSEERRQRLKKGKEGIEAEKVPEIGGFELLTDDMVSQGSQGRATKMTPLVIDCFYMDYDGKNYGPRPQRFIIPEFGGRKKIVDLDVYPARFDPACEAIRGELLKRGREFVSCVNRPHKEYHAYVLSDRMAILSADDDSLWSNIYEDPSLRSEVVQLDCECLIDQKATLDRYTPFPRDAKGITSTNKLGFHSGVLSKPTDSNQGELFDRLEKDKDQTDLYDDSKFDIDLRNQFINQTTLISSFPEITEDEQIELLPLRVFGYALQKRKWYAFNVLHLREPPAMKEAERSKAFNSLVLPEELRRTIRALVSHQVREITMPNDNLGESRHEVGSQRSQHKFDLIQGKGEGIILLFHGSPGVGKTSTAESVAIQLQRPLLPITCGDLGQEPYEVEQKLSTFFFLGAKWRCVVLLDEADVFLARRTTGDLKRNSLVSVFLRQLEYYSGLLILTTNRVGEFDEAFVSRIHMKLHFPSLDERSTMEVWDMNLRKLQERSSIEIRSKGIKKFAADYWKQNESQWNGRQIKNAFQTAVALAYWDWEQEEQEALATGKKAREKPVLRKTHFEDVAKTSLHFDNSMDKLYGAVGVDGKRRKGAFVREAERLRYSDAVGRGCQKLRAEQSKGATGVASNIRRQQLAARISEEWDVRCWA
ncbi:hypothetical protein D0863_05427 [Hortaea werneckii]|uniref:AAA+ ATPase domain-containing protein n=1 Tax=Hortaea werneckii TaxID=91943 RepID=A0A3M7E343_HORWE|nr:hypothetical protein D0863_05427 [Hortaea werneckii]